MSVVSGVLWAQTYGLFQWRIIRLVRVATRQQSRSQRAAYGQGRVKFGMKRIPPAARTSILGILFLFPAPADC